MKDEDFKGLVAGLEDAIAFVKGDSRRARVAAGKRPGADAAGDGGCGPAGGAGFDRADGSQLASGPSLPILVENCTA